MSSAQGHLVHPYEDHSLTLFELIELMGYVMNGNFSNPCTEKVDGINMLFKRTSAGVFFARSFTDIKAGGLTLDGLVNRFKDEPEVSETMHDAMAALEAALAEEEMSWWERNKWLDRWYSCDVVTKRHANVLLYDEDAVVIHSLVMSDDGVLRHNFDDPFYKISKKVGKWSFYSNRPINNRESGASVHVAATALLNLPNNIGMTRTLSTTLGDVYRHNVRLVAHYAGVPDYLLDAVVARVMKDPGHLSLTQIKKQVRYPSEVASIQKFVKDERNIMKAARAEVESIVLKHTIESLKNQSSFLIKDMPKETMRIRDAFSDAYGKLSYTEHSIFAEKQMKRLGALENINSAVEGVVVFYDKKKQFYKFTGWFAPTNQLLGVERYGNRRA